MIAYFTADLMWGGRIGAAGRAAGLEARGVRSPAAIEALVAAENELRGLLVELDGSEAPIAIIERARGLDGDRKTPPIRIVAFGPHVDAASLDRAREAGADQALPRGAVHQKLDELLAWLDGG